MNAIIGLCHFCESHGPTVPFYTYKQTNQMNNSVNNDYRNNNCPACSSIGDKYFVTKENNFTEYSSRQTPISQNINNILKHATIRSLSCEVSTSKDNALIFFGNSIQQEYVLSYTFQLKDTRARGLKRLFSIIIIMKDKMYLLNLSTHFSNQIKSVVSELEGLCEKVYAKEQATCSQRALRLKREKMDTDPPRSLVELTGKANVFAFLHMKFCTMLSSAAKVFKEVSSSTSDLLPDMLDTSVNLTESQFSMRQLKSFLTENIFLDVLYCTLVGIQVIVRGDSNKCSMVIGQLETLLPKKSLNLECVEYISPTESRLYSCKTNVAVPQPCSGVCRIDIVNEQPVMHWTGELPKNFPTLMTNIIKILSETKLSDSTIDQQILSMREEWKNHAMALKMIPYSSKAIITSMKRSLGVKAQDETLIEYWMANFVKL